MSGPVAQRFVARPLAATARRPHPTAGPGQAGGVPIAARFGVAEVYVGIAWLAIAVARVFPVHEAAALYRCPSILLFDLPCLTCGFTRAFVRSSHFNFAGAFAVSPLGAAGFGAIVLFAIYGLLRALFGWPWPGATLKLSRATKRLLRLGVVGIVLINWTYLVVHHRLIGDWL